jgi:hypothetical protein
MVLGEFLSCKWIGCDGVKLIMFVGNLWATKDGDGKVSAICS